MRSWLGRLRVRLGIRALMALVLVAGGGIGWVVHRTWVERDAAEAIRQAGGHLYYDRQWHDETVKTTARPGTPAGIASPQSARPELEIIP